MMKHFYCIVLCFALVCEVLTRVYTCDTHDYCVIGAGPAGLQLGYFLQKANRNYIIYERDDIAGSFFKKYPRHRKLISINKRNTGSTNKEYNLRHDWNSLISDDDDMLFRHYSKELFPPADDMVTYLNDFAKRYDLNVQYKTEVGHIEIVSVNRYNTSRIFTMTDQHGNVVNCGIIIMATGLAKPNIPNVPGINLTEGYEDLSTNSEDYEKKSVLILGQGNSAFETADAIYDRTNFIHMIGRHRIRLAWETHYVGDLRAVNNGLLDTYQLKSLDGLMEVDDINSYKFESEGGKLYFRSTDDSYPEEFDNDPLLTPYDKIIRCLGFSFDHTVLKSKSISKRHWDTTSKYPFINNRYQLVNVPGVYVAGTAAHSLDYRKSAGGFVHGFRYTARVLFRLLSHKYHSEKWFHTTMPLIDITKAVVKRINEASGIYQMFSVLADVVVIKREEKTLTYVEEFPLKLLHKFDSVTGLSTTNCSILVIVLEYGESFHGPMEDVFRLDRAATEPKYAHLSNFLHPVLYFYKRLPTGDDFKSMNGGILPRPQRLHHMVEDFNARWDRPYTHIKPLRTFLENCLEIQLNEKQDSDCIVASLTKTTSPPSCQRYMTDQTII